MSQKSTLACDVPGCPETYTDEEPRMSLKALRKSAADVGQWGHLIAPSGLKIELCPRCLKEIMTPGDPTSETVD